MLMKHVVITCVFIIAYLACHAQNQFGIFAGPQSSTATYSVRGNKQSTQNKFGFQAGCGWKIEFDNHLFFSPAAFYSLKGYKVKLNQFADPPDTAAIDNNTTMHTFELAFLLQFDLGNKPGHFFIKAGPSLDFQLAGKEKFHLKSGTLVDRDIPYGFSQYGHYAASLLMQLGFETKSGFMVFGQYNLGLGNLNNADNGPSIRHRVYGISIGTYLLRKKIVPGTRNKE